MATQDPITTNATHMTTATDPTAAPPVGKEPMLLLDTTGSMTYGTSESSRTPRYSTIGEAISLVVDRLAREDSQSAYETGGGGLRTITFANGNAYDLGDLSPQNIREKWNHIKWDGGTLIMPGWHKLTAVYREEFGDKPVEERPKLLALIITDGEARDFEEFSQLLSSLTGNTYVELAVIGYGSEHDQALSAYQQAAAQNPGHVAVTTFGSVTDPQAIADGLLAMIE
jgi:hypothetical protein